MNSAPIRNLSLAGLQGMNHSIYGMVNDRNYGTPQIVSRMHRYVTRALKAARTGNTKELPYSLVMALSWTCALANRKHIALDAETWRRFPGACSHCHLGPCGCDEKNPTTALFVVTSTQPATFRELQTMFARIYPKNTLEDEAKHLAEELGEVDEAVEHFLGTHERKLFDKIIDELGDVVAHICGVATCAGIVLAIEMEKVFYNGCPCCHKPSCDCGFTITTAPGGN